MGILRVNGGNVKRMNPQGVIEMFMARSPDGIFTRRVTIRCAKKTKRNETNFSGDEVGKVQEKM
jgi:hypothetical protein